MTEPQKVTVADVGRAFVQFGVALEGAAVRMAAQMKPLEIAIKEWARQTSEQRAAVIRSACRLTP